MSTTSTWPDRALYAALMQNPAHHFADPELQRATFARGRMGSIVSWNGARAIVFRATTPDGRICAVRFLINNDAAAGTRYDALSRYLSTNPVSSFVRTDWLGDGLRMGEDHFPVIKMQWVDGPRLDPYISEVVRGVDAVRALSNLADAWRQQCQALVVARISHGDIHAGNTLVLAQPGGPVEFRMVDYDNVWVPGLHAMSHEAGHPAYQHPRQPAARTGPHMDALPNTLMYLSLRALAGDPDLWRYHEKSDDTLLFHSSDMADTNREVWQALVAARDPQVRRLTELTIDWLSSTPGRYDTLEQALGAASSFGAPADQPGAFVPNTPWPVPPAAPAGHRPAYPWPGSATTTSPATSPAEPQTWPTNGAPPTMLPPLLPPTPTAGGDSHLARNLVLLFLVIIAIIAILATVNPS